MKETVLEFSLAYLTFTLILFLLFKKYLLSVFDPFLFVILALSSSLALSINSPLFYYIAISTLIFYLGFKIIGVPLISAENQTYFTNLRLLKIFTLLFFSIYFFLSIYILIESGIPLFSDNPTESKISIFSAGTGWLRRIIFLSNFLPICFTIIIIKTRKKFIYVLLFVIYTVTSLLFGSKSGLILQISIFWYIQQQNKLWEKEKLKLKLYLRSKIKYLIALTILIFIIIVLKESIIENSDPVYSIAFRLIEFGDIVLYYKDPIIQEYFKNLNLFDFFSYELNGILGMLRLEDYYLPLGYQMVLEYFNSDELFDGIVLGPNTLFFVKGHIFFGYFGGLLYCFLNGLFVAYLRKRIIETSTNNIFIYSFLVYLFFQISLLLKESSLFISTMFDMFFYLGPILIFSILIDKGLSSN